MNKSGFMFVPEGMDFIPDPLNGIWQVLYAARDGCPKDFSYAYDGNIKFWFAEYKLCPSCIETHGDTYGQLEGLK